MGAIARAADPGPTQSPSAVNPPFHGAAINAPFPDSYYGADHDGSSVVLSYPFVSPFGRIDHSRGVVTYYCAPFTPRNSEGVYGMDVWLETSVEGGGWVLAGQQGGLADGANSAYQPVNTPNPGPSPAYRFQWTFDATPLPPQATFRVWIYVYLYNQGGGSQGNFYVGSAAGAAGDGETNDPPSIAWDVSYGAVNPASVVSGQSYQVSATANDDNGNLASVQIWRGGSLFAAGGGGDGWTAGTAGSTAAGGAPTTYTAQAFDTAGAESPLISWTVSAASLQVQPGVSSADAALALGESFTPVELGGAGSGGWQFAVGGYTNFNGGATNDTGTQTAAGPWTPSWTAPAAGSYSFWVSRNGDPTFLPSAIAGPYALTVTDPSPPAGPPLDPPAPNPPSAAPLLSVASNPPPAGPIAGSPADGTAPAPLAAPTPAPDPAAALSAPAPNPFIAPFAPAPVVASSPTGSEPVSLLTPTSGGSTGTGAAPAVMLLRVPPLAPPEQEPAGGTAPAPPPFEIVRIRFNGTGHDATVHSQGPGGASLIWTDPVGLAASPWPSFLPAGK
jgi:hypothetical protein